MTFQPVVPSRAPTTPSTLDPNGTLGWVRFDAPPTNATIGDQAVLDLQTGDLYGFRRTPTPYGTLTIQIEDWLPDGTIVFTERSQTRTSLYTTRLGEAFQPVRTWDKPVAVRVSPDRRLLFATESASGMSSVFVMDAATLDVLRRVPDAYLVEPSTDGRYLALMTGLQSGLTRLQVLDLADSSGHLIESHGVQSYADSPVWSHAGAKLAYLKLDPGYTPTPGVAPSYELRVWDLRASSDIALGSAQQGGRPSWSPDDRYVAAGAAFAIGPAFDVYDLQGKPRRVMHVTESWFSGWLDNNTFHYTANICGGFDLRILDVASTKSTPVPHSDGKALYQAFSSPSGRSLAFLEEYGHTIRVMDMTAGSYRDYVTGLFDLPVYSNPGLPLWSPDERFIVLRVRGGKGGPCLNVPPPPPSVVELK